MTRLALCIVLFSLGFTCNCIAQDALPPLHTLRSRDIKQVTPRSNENEINVTLASGVVYVYDLEDWDLEEEYRSTDSRVKDAIAQMQRTFTKCEQPPAFPGGQEAWSKFVADFCEKHSKTIRKEGASQITIQVIVHGKGQLRDVHIVSNPSQSTLERDLLQAIRDSAPWVPGIQNGHKVMAYSTQVVNLSI